MENLRQKYTERLQRVIADTDEKLDSECDLICRITDEIFPSDAQVFSPSDSSLPSPEYETPEEFMEDYHKGDPHAFDLYYEAWEKAAEQLFWGHLREYGFNSLPFHVTRSITELESELHMIFVSLLVTEDHRERLEKYRMKEHEDEPETDVVAKPSVAKPSVATPTETPESIRKEQIEIFGYPKTEIVYNVKYWLDLIPMAPDRNTRIALSRKIFQYLAEPYGKKFIQSNEKFKTTLEQKLIEIRHVENIREAHTWWRAIFGTRMPPQDDKFYWMLKQ